MLLSWMVILVIDCIGNWWFRFVKCKYVVLRGIENIVYDLKLVDIWEKKRKFYLNYRGKCLFYIFGIFYVLYW